jgi:predicted transcriptional regulator of viral defense system
MRTVTKRQLQQLRKTRQAWAYVTRMRGRITVRDVADHLGCATGAAWDILDRLCHAGYIARGGDRAWSVVIPFYTDEALL